MTLATMLKHLVRAWSAADIIRMSLENLLGALPPERPEDFRRFALMHARIIENGIENLKYYVFKVEEYSTALNVILVTSSMRDVKRELKKLEDMYKDMKVFLKAEEIDVDTLEATLKKMSAIISQILNSLITDIDFTKRLIRKERAKKKS